MGVTAAVHDGKDCRRHCCQLAHCGNYADFFNTQDIDHWLVTIRVEKQLLERAQGAANSIDGKPAKPENWTSFFSRDKAGWQTAIEGQVGE